MDINFVFGNNNTFRVNVDASITVTDLYLIALSVVKQQILYLVSGATVLGISDWEKRLIDMEIFLVNNPTVTIVLRHPKLPYTDRDLVLNMRITKLLQKSQSKTENANNLLNWNGLVNFLSEEIKIPDNDYYIYATPVMAPYDCSEHSTCTICQDDFPTDQEEQKTVDLDKLECGHVFHSACIRRILTTSYVTCPVCSYDVRDIHDVAKPSSSVAPGSSSVASGPASATSSAPSGSSSATAITSSAATTTRPIDSDSDEDEIDDTRFDGANDNRFGEGDGNSFSEAERSEAEGTAGDVSGAGHDTDAAAADAAEDAAEGEEISAAELSRALNTLMNSLGEGTNFADLYSLLLNPPS